MNLKRIFPVIALAVTAISSASALAADNIAWGKTTSASSAYSISFASGKITDGRTTDAGIESTDDWGFWLASGLAPQWVQVDLGSSYQISGIALFDTHNRWYNDRGTNEFTLSISADEKTFSTIATSNFTSDQWHDQSALSIGPLAAVGRYVRLNVTSTYGDRGAGLAEMQVYGVAAPVPEAETYAMLLAGLALMGGIARRRKSV